MQIFYSENLQQIILLTKNIKIQTYFYDIKTVTSSKENKLFLTNQF